MYVVSSLKYHSSLKLQEHHSHRSIIPPENHSKKSTLEYTINHDVNSNTNIGTSFQEGLLDAINFLAPPEQKYDHQMIDFSFLFTIATGCEGIDDSDSVCTTEGEFGCFVVDESNLIAVSVIDYLNNFNRFKRTESTMSTGRAHNKFHRYNRYTSSFVRSLCTPEDPEDTLSADSSSLSTLSAESLSTLSAESISKSSKGASSSVRGSDDVSIGEASSMMYPSVDMDDEKSSYEIGDEKSPLLRKNSE